MAVHPITAATSGSIRIKGYTVTITDVPDRAAVDRAAVDRAAVDRAAVDRAAVDDDLDEYCDHLTVRGADGSTVGACRLMTPAGAAAAGRRCADGAFNLAGLRPLRDRLVDVDRFQVDSGHRSGAVVIMMWTAVARYLHLNDLRWVGGRAGVPADDGGRAAVDAWRRLRSGQLAPPALRVRPRRPCPVDTSPFSGPVSASISGPVSGVAGGRIGPSAAGPVGGLPVGGLPVGGLPVQLRGPLGLGAWVAGEPAYDPERRTADFYLLLSMDRLSPRHRRHFLGATR
jgi:putative hemolysin